MKKQITLCQNFNKAATTYDQYASVQHTVGIQLLQQLNTTPSNVLDVGCGSGLLTKQLAYKFNTSKIQAIDTSQEMISFCQYTHDHPNITFSLHDQSPFQTNKPIDLIFSNACFQWLPNLEDSLNHFGNLLNDGGTIAFTSFGPKTFMELQECLIHHMPKSPHIAATKFLDYSAIQLILSRLPLQITTSRIQHLYIPFTSILDLIYSIKYTGTSNYSPTGLWTRSLLQKIESSFLKQFGSIFAQYEIYTIILKKGPLS